MGERFAKAPEEHRGRRIESLQSLEHAREGLRGHVAHRLFPGVADAGAAVEVAAAGRLHVDLGQMLNGPMEAVAVLKQVE